MSVSTPETFKLTGAAIASEPTAVLAALAAEGITATASGATATMSTNTQLLHPQFEALMRFCGSLGLKLTYTPAA